MINGEKLEKRKMMIKYRESLCPDCGGHIPMAWISMWAFCTKCNRVWRVIENITRAIWYYPESVIIERIH